MKSVVVQVEDELANRLEKFAPGSHRRSEFVRAAILKALWEIEDQAAAEAYARQPDRPEGTFHPDLWDTGPDDQAM